MKFQPLTESEVTLSFSQEPEDTPVRGNALCSGDPAEDKRYEDEILARLDRGDINAWFCAKVTATWKGWEESAYLGGCCCKTDDDPEDELVSDLKHEALEKLNETIEREGRILLERFS